MGRDGVSRREGCTHRKILVGACINGKLNADKAAAWQAPPVARRVCHPRRGCGRDGESTGTLQRETTGSCSVSRDVLNHDRTNVRVRGRGLRHYGRNPTMPQSAGLALGSITELILQIRWTTDQWDVEARCWRGDACQKEDKATENNY